MHAYQEVKAEIDDCQIQFCTFKNYKRRVVQLQDTLKDDRYMFIRAGTTEKDLGCYLGGVISSVELMRNGKSSAILNSSECATKQAGKKDCFGRMCVFL